MKTKQTAMAFASMIPGAAALAFVSAAAQSPAQEVFQLVSVAGQPLPVLVEEEDGCRDDLLSATLTLESSGEWTLVTSEREVCGDRTEVEEESEDGTYRVDGQTVYFEDGDANQSADDDDDDGYELEIEELEVGTRSGDALVVRLADGETDLEFRR